MSREQYAVTTSEIEQLAEDLAKKARQLDSQIETIESEAFQRGIKEGMGAKIKDLHGKTLVLYTKEDPSVVCKSLEGLAHEFNAKIIVLNKEDDIKELHELELKSLGLKKLEDT